MVSDDDVYAVLQCIKANQTLKKLKLTGCVNITGRGLEPLRGSTVIVIEHIDLSLVKQYESPAIDPEPSISEAEVIPILDSIITADGNSLKFTNLPKKWRSARTTELTLTEYLGRYNRLLVSYESKCTSCESGFVGKNGIWWFATTLDSLGYKVFVAICA